jgi:putative DNA primase/helicase
MTGKHLYSTPFAIHDRKQALECVIAGLCPSQASSPTAALGNSRSVSDEDLIERAENGRNGDRFRGLWAGDTSDYDNDHSRADLALCRTLAFWCGGDCERVDRLFRRSGLMRENGTGGLATALMEF